MVVSIGRNGRNQIVSQNKNMEDMKMKVYQIRLNGEIIDTDTFTPAEIDTLVQDTDITVVEMEG